MLNRTSEARAQTQPPQPSLLLAAVDTYYLLLSLQLHDSFQEILVDADDDVSVMCEILINYYISESVIIMILLIQSIMLQIFKIKKERVSLLNHIISTQTATIILLVKNNKI